MYKVKLIIEDLGGTSAVAAMLDIKPPSVSEWISNNEIPKARLQYLRVMHPEVFERHATEEAA